MNNFVFHILKKDLRQLRSAWIVLLLATLAVTVYECTDWLSGGRISHNYMLVPMLLPFVWLQVAALLMRQESVVPDDAYWLTRPIPRHQLLGAKALFGLVVVVLPQAASFAIILTANGHSALEHWPVVLSGAITTGLIFLVGTMVASITRSHSQYWLTLLMMSVVSMILLELINGQQVRRWSGFQAALTLQTMAVAVPALIALLVWQYRHRRTQSVRVAFSVLAMVLLGLYGLMPLSAEHSLFASAPSVEIRFAPEATPATLPHRNGFALPLEIRGLPQDHRIWTDQATVGFTPTGSPTLTPNGYELPSVVEHENAWYLFVPPGQAGIDPWIKGPGELAVSLFLTVVEPTQPTTVPLQRGIVEFHGQRCRVGEEFRFSTIHCSTPADSTELLWTTLDAETGRVVDSNRLHSPSRSYGFFLEMLLTPLEFRAGASVRRDQPSVLEVKRSIVKSHFRADLKIDRVELRRYLSTH